MIRLALLAAVMWGCALTSQAQATITFPGCNEVFVVERLKKRFNKSEYYGALTQIVAVDRVHERKIENFGSYPISRRFCAGRAFLSDGTHTKVYFMIEGGMGFAGTGFNVETCLAGHDPWRVYGGWCRVLSR